MPDRKALHELEAAIADAGLEGRRMLDMSAVAIYQLEPTWGTAIACVGCFYVSLIPKLPRRALAWTCPRCGAMQRLAPPLEVLFLANRPAPAGVRAI